MEPLQEKCLEMAEYSVSFESNMNYYVIYAVEAAHENVHSSGWMKRHGMANP